MIRFWLESGWHGNLTLYQPGANRGRLDLGGSDLVIRQLNETLRPLLFNRFWDLRLRRKDGSYWPQNLWELRTQKGACKDGCGE
jgi:hypothetical protein